MKDKRQLRIDAHEVYCRNLAEQAINLIYSACTVSGQATPVKCHVDYRLTGATLSYRKIQTVDLEVKTVSPQYATKGSPLKVAKYYNMLKDHKNQILLLLSVEDDGTAYIYNLSKINLEQQAKKETWTIKEIEYQDDNKTKRVATPMFLIPKELAAYKLTLKTKTKCQP